MSNSVQASDALLNAPVAVDATAEQATAAAQQADKPGIVIEPPKGWQLVNVRELWKFRELLFFLTWRDVKVRYKQTALGGAWAILQPALLMVVFTMFIGKMANVGHDKFPYPIFVYSGLVAWMFFSHAITHGAMSLVGSEKLITKIYFPRLCVPFASVGAAVVDFFVSLTLLVAMMLWYGVPPDRGIVLAPVIFFVILLLAVGVSTTLAALNVAYRDFRYVIPFVMQAWMFATPSLYMKPDPSNEVLRVLMHANPMTGLIHAFRASVLGGDIPWGLLATSSLCAVVVFLFGCFYFRRVEDSFADRI